MEKEKRAASGSSGEHGARLRGLVGRTGLRRIMSYEEYFSGYTETRVLRGDRRGETIRRVYTDDYIRQDGEDAAWKQRKWEVGLSFLAAVLLHIAAGAQSLGGEEAAYVVVPGLLAVFFLLLSLFPVARYVREPRNMTKWDYRVGPVRVRIYALLAAACLFLAAGGVLVHALLTGYWTLAAWLALAGELAAGGLLLRVYVTEGAIGYRAVENDTPVSVEGYDIDS